MEPFECGSDLIVEMEGAMNEAPEQKKSVVFGHLSGTDFDGQGTEFTTISEYVRILVSYLQRDERFDWKNGLSFKITQEYD